MASTVLADFLRGEHRAAPLLLRDRALHDAAVAAAPDDTVRTLIFSGRPVRTLKTDYVRDWEENRQMEIMELCAKGIHVNFARTHKAVYVPIFGRDEAADAGAEEPAKPTSAFMF